MKLAFTEYKFFEDTFTVEVDGVERVIPADAIHHSPDDCQDIEILLVEAYEAYLAADTDDPGELVGQTFESIDPLAELSDEYGTWLTKTGHESMCALELRAELAEQLEKMTDRADRLSAHIGWLEDFSKRWDEVEEASVESKH